MKHLFVDYKLALKLRKKGFDEPCLAWKDLKDDEEYYQFTTEDLIGQPTVLDGKHLNNKNIVKLPLYQQVIDWFREKHNIHLWVTRFIKIEPEYYGWRINYGDAGDGGMMDIEQNSFELSYYEALNKAIEEALKLI